MSLIKGYHKGSDLTIMNTMYRYPRRQDDGKYSNGSMTIIYRDNVTGQVSDYEKENIFDTGDFINSCYCWIGSSLLFAFCSCCMVLESNFINTCNCF